MRAIKAVSQNYSPTSETLKLLDDFRRMVNDCIRIGLKEKVTSRQSLTRKAYHQLERYGDVPTIYRVSAASKAAGILKNYRKTMKKHPDAKTPFATKLQLVCSYKFQLAEAQVIIPLCSNGAGRPCRYLTTPLNAHVLRSISGYTVRSVTLTARTVSIAFSKETAVTNLTGLIGVDRNLDNATTATLNGQTRVYDLTEANNIKAAYREVRSHFTRNDARISIQLHGKYGRRQRNRVNQRLHLVSKAIVEQAKRERLGIVMENLKGIRKLYRKGNGQSRKHHAKMNSWSYYELQRQIEYKAKWEGIPVIYVQAARTSSTCAVCGSSVSECTERKVYCHKCNRIMDRDENAALNIVKRGVGFAPSGLASEAMVEERLTLEVTANPHSRCKPANNS